MVPDTRYAILGLLIQEPSHGYELTNRFAEIVGPGWGISSGQIYEMLKTLAEEGWVERLGLPHATRGSQRYKITHEGERVFAKWVSSTSSSKRSHRETLYLKLALTGPQDAHLRLQEIEIEKQACVDQLNTYAANTAPAPANPDEWETFAREAIDEDVTRQLHGKLEWLENLRKRIEHRLSQSPPGDTRAGASTQQTARRDTAA